MFLFSNTPAGRVGRDRWQERPAPHGSGAGGGLFVFVSVRGRVMRLLFAGACLALSLALVAHSAANSTEQGGKKITIKQVMQKCMGGKDPLCKKVASGKASKEEAQQLVEMFEAL